MFHEAGTTPAAAAFCREKDRAAEFLPGPLFKLKAMIEDRGIVMPKSHAVPQSRSRCRDRLDACRFASQSDWGCFPPSFHY